MLLRLKEKFYVNYLKILRKKNIETDWMISNDAATMGQRSKCSKSTKESFRWTHSSLYSQFLFNLCWILLRKKTYANCAVVCPCKVLSQWIFKYRLNRNRNDGKNQTSIEFSTKVQKCAHIIMKMWCVYNTQLIYTKNTCIMNKRSIFSFIIFDVIRLALFAGTPFHFVLYKSRVKSNTSVRAAVLLIYIAISYVFFDAYMCVQ